MADESANGGVLGHLPPWPRNALNNSVIGMEQAYRQRKGLPLLSDADIEALKAGVQMSWEEGGGAPVPAATAAEQARRGRKSLPPLTDPEITALLGEPAAAEPAAAATVAATAARPAA